MSQSANINKLEFLLLPEKHILHLEMAKERPKSEGANAQILMRIVGDAF